MAAKKNLEFDRTLFRPGERVAVAVSGGADSVALLLAMHAANHEQRKGRAVGLGVGLAAVHVHHGIRGAEADADTEFVRGLCARLGVPLRVRQTDAPAQAALMGETLEEAARNVRYGVFRDMTAAGEADTIATAHTLSDQAETVLMKLLRGAWTEGIGGIHPVLELGRGRVARPLLGVTRAEVESFLRGRQQEWREDQSNADAAYTRNRLRHELLPALRVENPKLDTMLANLAEIARGEQAHWQAELERLLPQVLLPGRPVRGGGRAVGSEGKCVAIELQRLRGMSVAMRRRVLRAAAESLGAAMNFAATERVLELCGIDDKAVTGKGALHLEGGLRAERSVREVRLFVENKDKSGGPSLRSV
jgi:tRNA(Ile)-lysidine synthase